MAADHETTQERGRRQRRTGALNLEERLEALEKRPSGHTDEQIVHMARLANRAVFYRYAAILSIVGLFIVGFLAVQASKDARDAADSVKDTQVAGCKASVRPGGARYIDAQNIARQVARSDAAEIDPVNVAAAFGIDVEQARLLIKQGRADQVDSIHDLLGVSCDTGRAIPDSKVPVPSVRALATPGT